MATGPWEFGAEHDVLHLIFSVDRFISEVRTLTSITGEGIAAIVVSLVGRRARPHQAEPHPRPRIMPIVRA